MALCITKKLSELAPTLVLAPERYDPRREVLTNAAADASAVRLHDIAQIVRHAVSPGSAAGNSLYLVLDTSNAKEGVITNDRNPVAAKEIGSTKKMAQPGDVIISRLRPYLRQVALVDTEIPHWSSATVLLCSTEFFVLRSLDARSLAFLVPFLLSAPVQRVLAASQEGGHHPRFDEDTLLGIPIPIAIMDERERSSSEVERSVALFRRSENGLQALIREAEAHSE